MDWEEVKEAVGCFLWIIIMILIFLALIALPGIMNAVQHWSDSL